MTADTRDELALADASYVGWSRIWAASVPGGRAVDIDGVALAVTGTPQEWWNVAIVSRPLAEPEAVLRRVVDWFDEHRQPFILRLREGLDPEAERAATALGFQYTDTLPAMVLAPVPRAPDPPPALAIERATDEAAIAAWVTIISESYEMTPDVTRTLLSLPLLGQDAWATFLGYAGGEPAATASVAVTDGVAGITMVGTRPSFRKRGFGEALTWQAIAEGAARGCAASVLEASPMGFPIYERMGFRHVTGHKTFVLPRYKS